MRSRYSSCGRQQITKYHNANFRVFCSAEIRLLTCEEPVECGLIDIFDKYRFVVNQIGCQFLLQKRDIGTPNGCLKRIDRNAILGLFKRALHLRLSILKSRDLV